MEITTNIKDNNFVDLVFSIQSLTQEKDCYVLNASGEHKGLNIGFGIEVKNDMKPGVINGGIDTTAFVAGGVKLFSLGELSNNFLKTLGKLYGLEVLSSMKEISLTAIALAGNPMNLKDEPVKFKLFNEIDDSEKYWEMFLNINIQKAEVEFIEKDEEYRKAIITSLSA